MKGYPRWFTRGKITVFTTAFFLSGCLLAPTTLALRMEWEVPWRLAEESRLFVAAAHAALSFLMFLLLGALSAVHIRVGWKKKRHRRSGIALVLILAFLGLSALGIYYSGNQTLSWSAGVSHLGAGLLFFLLYLIHLFQKVRRFQKVVPTFWQES